MGLPGERMIDRNEAHSRLAIFTRETDPAFEAICQEVNRSKSWSILIRSSDLMIRRFLIQDPRSRPWIPLCELP